MQVGQVDKLLHWTEIITLHCTSNFTTAYKRTFEYVVCISPPWISGRDYILWQEDIFSYFVLNHIHKFKFDPPLQ